MARWPAELDLDQRAADCKAIQRNRTVSAGATVLRLALARGPGGLSLRETAAWACQNGMAELSNPAVKFRLDRAPAFLEAILSGVLAARSDSRALLWPGRMLRLADGTCISKPGSTGTNWRVHGVYDLGQGGFSHLELSDAKGAGSSAAGRRWQAARRIWRPVLIMTGVWVGLGGMAHFPQLFVGNIHH